MVMFFLSCFFSCFILLFQETIHADINDNRFLPFISHHPFVNESCLPSWISIDTWFARATHSYDRFGQETCIPDFYGPYDLKDIDKAFITLGNPSPLPIEFQGVELPWSIEGKLQAQGIQIGYHQQLSSHVAVGTRLIFLRANSRQTFSLSKTTGLTTSQIDQIRELRRTIHQSLGLHSGDHAEQSGIADIDLYAQLEKTYKYFLKFRRIKNSLRLGVLLPTGERKDQNRPASIPFGGDKHPGIYVAYDGFFELKEDLSFGLYAQCTKRLTRTKLHRVALGKEPSIFGPIVDTFRVSPEVTLSFSPYLIFENIREGLGIRIQYSLRVHGKDSWKDARANRSVPVNLFTPRKQSKWSSDYFTLGVFYDFGKVKPKRALEPTIAFTWDIPSSLFMTKNVVKTHVISLGIEIDF